MAPHRASRTPRLDALAAQAARRFVDGAVATVAEAIDSLRGEATAAELRELTPGRVRQHIEADTMSRIGVEAVSARRGTIIEIAEELMTLFEESIPLAKTLLVGRAAAGRLDGEVTLHLRVYTTAGIADLASLVVEAGHEEPSFRTVETRFGRMDRLEFVDGPISVRITRCPRSQIGRSGPSGERRDLHTGRAVETLDLVGVRRMLSRFRP